MSISTVTTDDLRRMNGKEGLVLQGCGGDPQEWLDGINKEYKISSETWTSKLVEQKMV